MISEIRHVIFRMEQYPPLAWGITFQKTRRLSLSFLNHILFKFCFSCFLYTSFILILGSTCVRDLLYTNYLIAAKVSALGVYNFAVYIISSSSKHMTEPCYSAFHRGPVLCWTLHFIAIEQFGLFLGHSSRSTIHRQSKSHSLYPRFRQRGKWTCQNHTTEFIQTI